MIIVDSVIEILINDSIRNYEIKLLLIISNIMLF